MCSSLSWLALPVFCLFFERRDQRVVEKVLKSQSCHLPEPARVQRDWQRLCHCEIPTFQCKVPYHLKSALAFLETQWLRKDYHLEEPSDQTLPHPYSQTLPKNPKLWPPQRVTRVTAPPRLINTSWGFQLQDIDLQSKVRLEDVPLSLRDFIHEQKHLLMFSSSCDESM